MENIWKEVNKIQVTCSEPTSTKQHSAQRTAHRADREHYLRVFMLNVGWVYLACMYVCIYVCMYVPTLHNLQYCSVATYIPEWTNA